MSSFLSIRNDPLFRRYFDAITPFFWPVLYWQLKCAWLSLHKEKRTSFLLAISWWGGVRVLHRGDKMVVAKPNPLAPTRPRWDDPVWSSQLPVTIAALHAHIFPCEAGEVAAKGAEGALVRHPCHPGQGAPAPPIRDLLSAPSATRPRLCASLRPG